MSHKKCSCTCHHIFERLLFPCFVFLLCLSCLYFFSRSSTKPNAHPQNEEYCPVAIHNPLTCYEPNQLDNFDYSETFAAIFQNESVDIDTEPSYSCDAELDDELTGKALSSPLFIQERQEPVNLKQTCHSHEESLLSAQSFFTRTSTGRPVYESISDLSQKRKSSRDLETSKSGFSLKDKNSKFLLTSYLISRSTNFEPNLTKEVSRNQLELLILSEWKLIILL